MHAEQRYPAGPLRKICEARTREGFSVGEDKEKKKLVVASLASTEIFSKKAKDLSDMITRQRHKGRKEGEGEREAMFYSFGGGC